MYSYGDTFKSGRCNTPFEVDGVWQRGQSLAPSGAYENCANDFGVHDMIGNAWEWTSTWYSRPDLWRVVRGGSYFHSANLARADAQRIAHDAERLRAEALGAVAAENAELRSLQEQGQAAAPPFTPGEDSNLRVLQQHK